MKKFRLKKDGRHGYTRWYMGAGLILFASIWALNTWVGLTMDELVYHLTSDLDGTGGGMIEKFVTNCIIPAIILGIVVYLIFVILDKKGLMAPSKQERSKKEKNIRRVAWCIPWVMIIVAAVHFNNGVGFINYVKGQIVGSTFVEENYVDPKNVDLQFPEEKRNLVYVYLESMERTYSDEASGGAFEENVIPHLTEIGLENENFAGDSNELNGAIPLPGATWTMGGIMAQSAALPLQLDIRHNAMSSQDKFFSDMVGIGDILEDEGYHQVYMLGSKASFGGRDTYYKQHGNFDIMDYRYAVENGWIDEDYYVFWGFEDEILLQHAKEELTILGNESLETGVPFNFNLLTVDTHFEDGYVCDLCENNFDEQYSNVMYCSSKQIGELVEWIQQQPWYDNTTVVLSGDHLTMDSDYCVDVSKDYQRKTYVSIINGDPNNGKPDDETGGAAAVKKSVGEEREYSTFDMFPTTLAAMNVGIPGDKLGLGTNLYSDTKTEIEEYGLDFLNDELSKKSKFIEKLANIDMSQVTGGNADADVIYMDIELEDYDLATNKGKIVFRNVSGGTENTTGFTFNYYENKSDKKPLTSGEMKYDSAYGGYTMDIDLSNYEYGKSKFKVYAVGGSGKDWETMDISPIIYQELMLMNYNANSDTQTIEVTGSGNYPKKMQPWVQEQLESYGYDVENKKLKKTKFNFFEKLFKQNYEGIQIKITEDNTGKVLYDVGFSTNKYPMKVYD
ncbi:MAG: sulfatase-like hydrolase/transferase [Lachnospiraceae bacterium]|nr:sulfatase-like hydrolase/transferase [Lachnospiraceae bacterium]